LARAVDLAARTSYHTRVLFRIRYRRPTDPPFRAVEDTGFV
jgi:hypothetical protein